MMSDRDFQQEDGSQAHLSFMEHRVPRDGYHLYAREYPGAGPAFVFMHGFPDNLHIYDKLIPVLVSAGRHVVAFDFLGFGSSDKPAGYNYSFEQQHEDLATIVEFLDLDRVIPVGHDAGGVAAIDYVLSHRERVSALGLLNTFYGVAPSLRLPELLEIFTVPGLSALADAIVSDPTQLAFLLHFQQTQFKIGASDAQVKIIDDVLQPLINQNFSQVPGAGPAFARLARTLPLQIPNNTARWEQVESLKLPTAIIWGQRDAFLASGVAEDFAKRIEGASLHLLDAGHWPQLDRPDEVAAHLLADLHVSLAPGQLL
jgi:haloalkane dehalogenase